MYLSAYSPMTYRPNVQQASAPQNVALNFGKAADHLKVVIVDDEFPIRYILRTILETIGIHPDNIQEVDTGEAALEALVGKDWVITDNTLAGNLTGVELLQHIFKEIPEAQRPKVTLITGEENAIDAVRRLYPGQVKTFKKPIDTDEVQQSFEETIRDLTTEE